MKEIMVGIFLILCMFFYVFPVSWFFDSDVKAGIFVAFSALLIVIVVYFGWKFVDNKIRKF